MLVINESQKLEQLAHKLDPHAKLLRAWPLKGGVSAQVAALEIAQADGQVKRLIVRRHGALDLKHNPHVAADEFRLLQLLHSAGLAVPAPYLLDQSGAVFPSPYLVIEYIASQPAGAPSDLNDLLGQLAAQLSNIHAVDLAKLDVSFLPQQADRYDAMLRAQPADGERAGEAGRIRVALRSAWTPAQHNRSVLLHGDFWPGNILWRDGRLVGVIDWEDAAVGDPLADLANSRLEILWASGVDAMERFTQLYLSFASIDAASLPAWDLCAALRPAMRMGDWGLDRATETRMRDNLGWFVAQALEKLSIRRS